MLVLHFNYFGPVSYISTCRSNFRSERNWRKHFRFIINALPLIPSSPFRNLFCNQSKVSPISTCVNYLRRLTFQVKIATALLHLNNLLGPLLSLSLYSTFCHLRNGPLNLILITSQKASPKREREGEGEGEGERRRCETEE